MPSLLAVVDCNVDLFGCILKFIPERILDVYHACKKTREVIAKNRVPLVFNSLSANSHFYFVCSFARKFAMHEDCAVAAMTLVKDKFSIMQTRTNMLQDKVRHMSWSNISEVGLQEHMQKIDEARLDLRGHCEYVKSCLAKTVVKIDGSERHEIPVLVAALRIAQLHRNSLPLALSYAKILDFCVHSLHAQDFLTDHHFVVLEDYMDRHMSSMNIVEIYASIVKEKPMGDGSYANEIGLRVLCRMQAFLNMEDIADVKLVENFVISIWRHLSCYSGLCDHFQRLDLCRTFVSLMLRIKEEKVLEWVWTTLLTFFTWKEYQLQKNAQYAAQLPDKIDDARLALRRLVLDPYFEDLHNLACESLSLHPHNEDIARSCKDLFKGLLK